MSITIGVEDTLEYNGSVYTGADLRRCLDRQLVIQGLLNDYVEVLTMMDNFRDRLKAIKKVGL